MEKFKEGTCGWYIACIRDPVIRKEVIAGKDYHSHKKDNVDGLPQAIIFATDSYEDARKYKQQAYDGKIAVADQPVEDSIGAIPSEYWVENPFHKDNGEKNETCEMAVLAKKLADINGGHCPNGTSKYYKYTNGKYALDFRTTTPSGYILPYETWKAYVLEVIGEKVVGSGVSVLPAEYQISGRGHQTDEFRRLLTIAVGEHDMLGGSEWYSIRNGEVDAHSEDTNPGLPIISYTDWKRILEGKSVKEEVSAAKPIQHTYSVGDWVVPIVDTNDSDYELGATDLEVGKVYQVQRVAKNYQGKDYVKAGNSPANCILTTSIRMATQSEIDQVNPPKVKPVDKIEVGSWVMVNSGYIPADGNWNNWAGEGDRFLSVGPYQVEEIGGHNCIRKMGGKTCTLSLERFRLATAAEIAKATQGKEKVSDKAPEIGSWVMVRYMDGIGIQGQGIEEWLAQVMPIDTTASGKLKEAPNCIVVKTVKENYPGNYRVQIEATRPATAAEIATDQLKPTPPEPWSAITTDGVKVYEGDRVWWVEKDGNAHNTNAMISKSYESSIKDGWPFFSSKEAADRYIAEHIGKKESPVDEWKVGDILPEEWLKKNHYYGSYKGHKNKTCQAINDREVKEIKEGWGLISGSSNCWLGPKSEYPTYKTEVEGKQVTSTNQSQSINQTIKTKSNVNNNEEGSSDKDSITDSRYNLRTNPKVSEGHGESRRETASAIRKIQPKVAKD